MYTLGELDVAGYQGRMVPNTFVHRNESASRLAVLYPGFGYSCDMPLFYYKERLLLDLGADVLRVEYAYNRRPEFLDCPASEQHAWQFADATAALELALQHGDYEQTTIVGKSIGTRAMGHLLSSDPRVHDASLVWLTPLLGEANLRQQILQTSARSLIVIGTADPHFDSAFLEEFAQRDSSAVFTIDDGDHSLDVDGDIAGSIRALEQVIERIGALLAL